MSIAASPRRFHPRRFSGRRLVDALRVGLLSAAPILLVAAGREAAAQNDWQYPDPYFGILEFESSRTSADDRRYRGEINPAPRPPRKAASRQRHGRQRSPGRKRPATTAMEPR